jgi:hypothetical protein
VAWTLGCTAGAPEEVRANVGGGEDESRGAFSGGGEAIDEEHLIGLRHFCKPLLKMQACRGEQQPLRVFPFVLGTSVYYW